MTGAVPRQGGATWAVLQYALGLKRLGHDVVVLESVPREKLVPRSVPIEKSVNATYTRAAMDTAGLAESWSLLQAGSHETVGLSREAVSKFAKTADVLVNLGGTLRDEEILALVPTRVFLDVDPGFTQVWSDVYGSDLGLDLHTHFVTYGLSLTDPSSKVPKCAKRWNWSPPPVVLDSWREPTTPDESGPWTTVANWRSYGTIEHAGVRYGQKAHSWRQLFPLPTLVPGPFEIALSIDESEREDLHALRDNGWRLVDPSAATGNPQLYREFVWASKAELSVAKEGYVRPASGWFSDRSACYLAAGRPVAAQETGFSRFLPTEEGLVAFSDLETARQAVESVNSRYVSHCKAAAELAREFFDSDRVLSRLLDMVGGSS
jgi:hypothetical protein